MIFLRYCLFTFIYLLFSLIGALATLQDNLKETYKENRRYNEVCWLTAHNAYANASDGWTYCQQYLSFEEQYQFGVRSFMLDLYWYSPGAGQEPYIALCHEFSGDNEEDCFYTRAVRFLNAPTPFASFLKKIKQWLDSDKTEIITLHLENYLSYDSKEAIDELFEQEGLAPYVFTIDQFEDIKIQEYIRLNKSGNSEERIFIDQWPTLKDMRQKQARLIVFSDRLPREIISSDSLLPISTIYRETQFDLTKYEKCEMRENGREPKAPLFLMNHFYNIDLKLTQIPQTIKNLFKNLVVCNSTSYAKKHMPFFSKTNSYESIMNRVNQCYAQEQRLPNFIAIDFVELGNDGGAKRVVTELNQRPSQAFHPGFQLNKNLKINEIPNQPNITTKFKDEL